jgi:hypothetical protein
MITSLGMALLYLIIGVVGGGLVGFLVLALTRAIGITGLIAVLVLIALVAVGIWAPAWLGTAALLGGLAIGASAVLMFCRELRSQLSHG